MASTSQICLMFWQMQHLESYSFGELACIFETPQKGNRNCPSLRRLEVSPNVEQPDDAKRMLDKLAREILEWRILLLA